MQQVSTKAMEFEIELYESLKAIFPTLSVRGMSKLLGKSSGYWSSIMAQQLSVSNQSLVQLLDALECQKILSSPTTPKSSKISSVQEFIVNELAMRFQVQTGLEQVGEYNYSQRDDSTYDAMPFIVSSY